MIVYTFIMCTFYYSLHGSEVFKPPVFVHFAKGHAQMLHHRSTRPVIPVVSCRQDTAVSCLRAGPWELKHFEMHSLASNSTPLWTSLTISIHFHSLPDHEQ